MLELKKKQDNNKFFSMQNILFIYIYYNLFLFYAN